MVSNVIAFVAGNNDESDSSLSSGEIVECDSDCSQCASDNQSISMNSSSQHEQKEDAVDALVREINMEQAAIKRRKENS
jgi:hypothetical protein